MSALLAALVLAYGGTGPAELPRDLALHNEYPLGGHSVKAPPCVSDPGYVCFNRYEDDLRVIVVCIKLFYAAEFVEETT